MVDFKKKLAGKKAEKPSNPVQLYETLDRAHDKGPLRPAQLAVLTEWSENYNTQRDVIIKLHTGQGKTLIGLLLLQARLNAGKGPAMYLCPDNFLISQTCEQAKQFGIATCSADPELPDEFLNGSRILVTSVQKLFNGLTKFGLNKQSISVDTFLMDDAHACADTIREQCRIRIPNDEPAYQAIKTLFAADLEMQGAGTYADICNDKREALLPVPYWAWIEHEAEIATILSREQQRPSIKFAWPLLKDMLTNCLGIISGAAFEIEPYIAPLSVFGTYWKAEHRIFMSATVTDDSFLVKGLQLKPETIINPLTYDKETWSGEKMVLLPSLIDETLNPVEMLHFFAVPKPKRQVGVVALSPSFSKTKDWSNYGARIASKETVSKVIDDLKAGRYEETVVLVNRYDGIDLPDDSCRVLVFDGKPYSESLMDSYQELCRPNSEATLMRTIRTVEQGMGRSVRGEKDYCVIVVIGSDIVRLLRDKESRKYLSTQMSAQIELGLEIAKMAQEEIENGEKPIDALTGLMNQCLGRDEDWKAFYVGRMNAVRPKGPNEEILRLYANELVAEQLYTAGNYGGATQAVQALLDSGSVNQDDKGWYLQEMARYNYRYNRTESQNLQVAAYNGNRLLLRPQSGVTVSKLTVLSQGRLDAIAAWLCAFDSYSEMDIALSDILAPLVFGSKADKFEQALYELGKALGFAGERPDKEWKEGPDNLWALDTTQYLLWECKNEVGLNRAEINKHESEQMNRSSAWFEKHYQGLSVKRIIIHPSCKVQSAAAFTHEAEAMREAELKRLVKVVREFFKSFESQDFKNLSSPHIQKMIDAHGLRVVDLTTKYSKKLVDHK